MQIQKYFTIKIDHVRNLLIGKAEEHDKILKTMEAKEI